MQVNKIIKKFKNIKKTWIGICIVLIIFLGSLWWHHKNTFILENFVETGSDTGAEGGDPDKNDENSKTNRFYKFIGGKTDGGYSFGGITKGLDAVIDALTIKEKKKPRWNDLEYDDGELTDSLNLYTSRDISNLELEIINDNCSKRSVLKSDYKDDICEKYIGDYSTINEKCRGLNENSCAAVNCCVLLNGNKCVAGNKIGPTFYTDGGNDITFKYYEHRGIRYPEYKEADDYKNKCGSYANNSTGVSRECMVQLFNEAGCSNKDPYTIITDEYVENNSKSTKRFIKNDLIKKVIQLKIVPNDEIIKKDKSIMCYGPVTECDKFFSYDTNISADCMSDKFEQERLEQLKTYYRKSAISDASINEIGTFITDDNVELMKNTNKIGIFKWIKDKVQYSIVNNVPCSVFKDTDKKISTRCMDEMLYKAGCTTPTPEYFFNEKNGRSNYSDLFKKNKADVQKAINFNVNMHGIWSKHYKNFPYSMYAADYNIRCYGRKGICDNYSYDMKGIGKECMENMFDIFIDDIVTKHNTANPAKLLNPDQFDTFIDDAYVSSMAKRPKYVVANDINTRINKMVTDFAKKK